MHTKVPFIAALILVVAPLALSLLLWVLCHSYLRRRTAGEREDLHARVPPGSHHRDNSRITFAHSWHRHAGLCDICAGSIACDSRKTVRAVQSLRQKSCQAPAIRGNRPQLQQNKVASLRKNRDILISPPALYNRDTSAKQQKACASPALVRRIDLLNGFGSPQAIAFPEI